ncbi:arsenate reductase ArsC [Fibrobacterota bacterium]
MRILVLCTGNSCRSQMTQGFLEQHTGIDAYSAGVSIHRVHPGAIKVMREKGIDISHHTSNHVDEYLGLDFDLVITVCDNANEKCPVFPARTRRIHKNFPDPVRAKGSKEEILSQFRRTRDMIKSFCDELVAEIKKGRVS